MKATIFTVLFLSVSLVLMPATASSAMVDRPGELIELAEQLALNIQSAEEVRDGVLKEIGKRSKKLKEIDKKLENTRDRASRLELMAQKTKIEMEENSYRQKAISVVKEQMDNVFMSLENMREELDNLRGQETIVDPEVAETFNQYFRTSAHLLKSVGKGMDINPKTFAMLENLQKSLIVSQKSSDFLENAVARIKEYQKVVALYNGKLSYLGEGLAKLEQGLLHKRDAITIGVSLETTEQFMEGLDTDNIEDVFMEGLSIEEDEYFSEFGVYNEKRMRIPGKRVKGLMDDYMEGGALSTGKGDFYEN
jgi:Skp family chaperone for outer membrane proteins